MVTLVADVLTNPNRGPPLRQLFDREDTHRAHLCQAWCPQPQRTRRNGGTPLRAVRSSEQSGSSERRRTVRRARGCPRRRDDAQLGNVHRATEQRARTSRPNHGWSGPRGRTGRHLVTWRGRPHCDSAESTHARMVPVLFAVVSSVGTGVTGDAVVTGKGPRAPSPAGDPSWRACSRPDYHWPLRSAESRPGRPEPPGGVSREGRRSRACCSVYRRGCSPIPRTAGPRR